MVRNFNTISLTFLISNIIAMPLLGICIIGGYLLTIISFMWLGLAKKIGIIFNIFLKVLLLIAKICGNLKLSNIYVVTPNKVTIIIYYILLFIVVYTSKLKKKIVVDSAFEKIFEFCKTRGLIKKSILVILILVIILEIPWSNYNGKLKIYFIDVGQRR